ncbi:MAG: hypothetical protein L0196_07680 [candidate division Zixibacteria bacterium]|nr:hypothetical protein [candidate division Zixibacteria bacterium]
MGTFIVQTAPTIAQDYYNPKSEKAAEVLSFFGTAVPVAFGVWQVSRESNNDYGSFVAAGGLILGPAAGYFYADMPRRGLIGMGIRTILFTGTLITAAAVDNSTSLKHFDRTKEAGEVLTVLVVGTSAVALAALVDILSVREAVKKQNQKLYYCDFTLLPAYFTQHQAGSLQLRLAF